jgi:hypothetical protein
MGVYDLTFVLTAIAFNFLIIGIFVASKHNRLDVSRRIGIVWLLLAIPLVIVFVRYWIVGKSLQVMVCFGVVFFYMFVEWLLDFVLKVDFRAKAITHVPYIILEYAALFSLIVVAFTIDRTWGWIVTVAFWLLLASLIYLFVGKRKEGISNE